jgi:hypothetical protein
MSDYWYRLWDALRGRPVILRVTLVDPSAEDLADWLRLAGLDIGSARTVAFELVTVPDSTLGREIGRGVTVRRIGACYTITWPYSNDE